MDKPYAPACDRNREPILDVLRDHFATCRSVLEIGSGTGQHAVHFAQALPHLTWQTSDRADNLPGITLWLDEAGLPNTPPPLALAVSDEWPLQSFDALFTANTLHIMSWEEVEELFLQLPTVATPGTVLAIYGPFNYDGKFTSDSNAAFDASLKSDAPHRGIRDFEAVDGLASIAGFKLVEDRAMPSNNRCVVWRWVR